MPRQVKHYRRIIVFAAVLVIVALAGTGVWIYCGRGRSSFTSAHPDRALYPVRGIDISAHNGIVDFEALSADSIDFVIIKATEGATFKDRAFDDNMRMVRRSSLAVGVYHFFRFDSPGHMQALNFLNCIRGRDFDMPLVIDVEEWGNPSDVSTDVVLDRLSEMADYIVARGYRVMIYTNKDGYARFFNNRPGRFPLWICSFTNPPGPSEWQLWQYSHRGGVDGVDGNVDMNTFNGSRDDWRRWLDSMATPPVVDSSLKVR